MDGIINYILEEFFETAMTNISYHMFDIDKDSVNIDSEKIVYNHYMVENIYSWASGIVPKSNWFLPSCAIGPSKPLLKTGRSWI